MLKLILFFWMDNANANALINLSSGLTWE